MKVLVIYRPNSEHARLVDDFVREFQRRYPDSRLDILDIDSRDGSATASLYDVMEHPAILILQNDGYLQKSWMGASLPMLDEVFAYAQA
jgi:hypothetical protein